MAEEKNPVLEPGVLSPLDTFLQELSLVFDPEYKADLRAQRRAAGSPVEDMKEGLQDIIDWLPMGRGIEFVDPPEGQEQGRLPLGAGVIPFGLPGLALTTSGKQWQVGEDKGQVMDKLMEMLPEEVQMELMDYMTQPYRGERDRPDQRTIEEVTWLSKHGKQPHRDWANRTLERWAALEPERPEVREGLTDDELWLEAARELDPERMAPGPKGYDNFAFEQRYLRSPQRKALEERTAKHEEEMRRLDELHAAHPTISEMYDRNFELFEKLSDIPLQESFFDEETGKWNTYYEDPYRRLGQGEIRTYNNPMVVTPATKGIEGESALYWDQRNDFIEWVRDYGLKFGLSEEEIQDKIDKNWDPSIWATNLVDSDLIEKGRKEGWTPREIYEAMRNRSRNRFHEEHGTLEEIKENLPQVYSEITPEIQRKIDSLAESGSPEEIEKFAKANPWWGVKLKNKIAAAEAAAEEAELQALGRPKPEPPPVVEPGTPAFSWKAEETAAPSGGVVDMTDASRGTSGTKKKPDKSWDYYLKRAGISKEYANKYFGIDAEKMKAHPDTASMAAPMEGESKSEYKKRLTKFFKSKKGQSVIAESASFEEALERRNKAILAQRRAWRRPGETSVDAHGIPSRGQLTSQEVASYSALLNEAEESIKRLKAKIGTSAQTDTDIQELNTWRSKRTALQDALQRSGGGTGSFMDRYTRKHVINKLVRGMGSYSRVLPTPVVANPSNAYMFMTFAAKPGTGNVSGFDGTEYYRPFSDPMKGQAPVDTTFDFRNDPTLTAQEKNEREREIFNKRMEQIRNDPSAQYTADQVTEAILKDLGSDWNQEKPENSYPIGEGYSPPKIPSPELPSNQGWGDFAGGILQGIEHSFKGADDFIFDPMADWVMNPEPPKIFEQFGYKNQ